MAGQRIVYCLSLLGSLAFYIFYQQWISWLLLLGVIMLPWLSLLISIRSILRLKLEPFVGEKLPMGTKETVLLKVQTKGVQPPVKSKVSVVRPITGESWVLRSGDTLPADHCGGLVLLLHKPRVYDHLGLFRFRVRKLAQKTCAVLPQPVRVEVPTQLTQHMARSWRPKPGGGYAENHEIRPYRPGDSLNQIHWKLTAKVGQWMLREAMEPEQEGILLTMNLRGTPAEIDQKLGRLLWLGEYLLARQSAFQLCVLTGNGLETWTVCDQWDMKKCMEALLFAPFAPEGSVWDYDFAASWQYHIGGEPDGE